MSYTIEDLKTLMARLRDPDTGCPWDTRQTYTTIVPHTIEEAYEVADAIERADFPHLKDELGDLLFQVIFYARLGQEDGHFDFDAIVDHLVRKLLRRHPHVFPEGTLESRVDPDKRPDDAWIRESWERIKARERADKPPEEESASRLDGIARTLPAMLRAEKLQRRAARAGFDWPDIGPVFDKLQEEIGELREAWQAAAASGAAEDLDSVEDELGDLLFVCVNLARFMRVNPEQALARTNRKFERRFRAIEKALAREGRKMEQEPLEVLDAIWQSVKGVERQEPDTR